MFVASEVEERDDECGVFGGSGVGAPPSEGGRSTYIDPVVGVVVVVALHPDLGLDLVAVVVVPFLASKLHRVMIEVIAAVVLIVKGSAPACGWMRLRPYG